jgi:tetratricopeptide (TPR) repeat protein
MKSGCVSNKCFLLVWLLILSSAVFAQSTANPVAAITSALRNREFDQALQLLQPALQSAPNNPQLWAFQGLAYSGKGNQKAALGSYQAALKIASDYLPALEGAAQLEYEAGSPAAIPLLEHILKLRPNESTTHAMLAVLAVKNGDCTTAVTHFSLSGPILQTQPDALRQYGACLLKLKQPDKAAQIFRELLANHPDDARDRRALAATQLAAGQPQDALSTLKSLLDSSPDVTTRRLAAAAYEANKDTPTAVKILRDAIVKDPMQIDLYVDFADIAMTHQSFQAGIEMIDAGLKLQPSVAQLYLARGVLYVQLAEYDKAEADFDKAEQLDPAQGLSGAAQGLLAEEKDKTDPDEALAIVRAKLKKQPEDAFLLYLQAAILSKKSPEPGSAEFQQGMASGKRAVELQPSLTAAHNVLAKYYLDSGQYALAAKECRLVLEQNPADQTALYHLVLALRKTNEKAEIPDLLKRLAAARQNATREEGERNRYKLVVAPQ